MLVGALKKEPSSWTAGLRQKPGSLTMKSTGNVPSHTGTHKKNLARTVKITAVNTANQKSVSITPNVPLLLHHRKGLAQGNQSCWEPIPLC